MSVSSLPTTSALEQMVTQMCVRVCYLQSSISAENKQPFALDVEFMVIKICEKCFHKYQIQKWNNIEAISPRNTYSVKYMSRFIEITAEFAYSWLDCSCWEVHWGGKCTVRKVKAAKGADELALYTPGTSTIYDKKDRSNTLFKTPHALFSNFNEATAAFFADTDMTGLCVEHPWQNFLAWVKNYPSMEFIIYKCVQNLCSDKLRIILQCT